LSRTVLQTLVLSMLPGLGCVQPITSADPGPSGSALAVSAGAVHACGLELSGQLRCWGKGGLVGDGTRALRPTAVDVPGLERDVLSVVSGESHSCALTRNGLVSCWGSGADQGQLGPTSADDHDPVTESLQPRPIDFESNGNVSAIAAGVRHTCALQVLGDVWCWGDNAQWQVGFGADAIAATPNPLQLSPGKRASGMRAVAAGEAHTCVVTASGDVNCWGSNERGQLGLGSTGGVAVVPQLVSLGVPVIAVAAGRAHTCALLADGSVRCWGANLSGQLGDDTGVDSPRPVSPKIDPGLKVVAVAAGGDVTCAVTEDHALRCWGDNDGGQLGDGSNLPRFVPQQVHGLTSNIRTVAAGLSSTCAVTLAGQAYCWGRNDQGQLGDGTNSDRNTPVEVKGL